MAKVYTHVMIATEGVDYAKQCIEEKNGCRVIDEHYADRYEIVGSDPNSSFAIFAEENKIYTTLIVEQEVDETELEFEVERLIDVNFI